MRKLEIIYREILDSVLENNQLEFTQLALAKKLSFSLSTINHAVKPLAEIGAIEIRQRSLRVIDTKKFIYYWATVRKFQKDIIYSTRVEKSVQELEKITSNSVIFTAFTAYLKKFKEVPADYSEIYFYAVKDDLEEVKKRFPERKGPPNIFVLSTDEQLIKEKRKLVSNSQLFVDLWNIKQWYAHEFLKKLEERLFK